MTWRSIGERPRGAVDDHAELGAGTTTAERAPRLRTSDAEKAIALRTPFCPETGTAAGLARLLEELASPHLFLDAAALDQLAETANRLLNALPFTNRELDHTNPDELEIPGTKLQRVAEGARKVYPAPRRCSLVDGSGEKPPCDDRGFPRRAAVGLARSPGNGPGIDLDCPFSAPGTQLSPASPRRGARPGPWSCPAGLSSRP